MNSNRTFQIAFLISLTVHGVIFYQNLNFNFLSGHKQSQKLEIIYSKNLQENQKTQDFKTPKKESILNTQARIAIENRTIPPKIEKERIFRKNPEIISRKLAFTKPTLIKPDIIAIKKKITLPPVDLDKIDNPSYISYYQIVREKIRTSAYKNFTQTETGEVFLSFVISSEGALRDVKLIEKKSTTNSYLKNIAYQSIKDASPFGRFPKELDYPQLTFNVVISFEIE